MQASTKMYTELGMESNIEDMKDMFLETNVYLLSLTMVVSLLHSFFEILVMKNGRNKINGVIAFNIINKNNLRNTILAKCTVP